MDFTTLPDLCDERLGSAVVGRNDEYFALADNLLRPEPPVWVADRFTKRGKWMDGWETRRRRTAGGTDWCIVRLGAPGVIAGIVVDTAHFTGNFPKECWLEGCGLDGYPSADELADAPWMPLGARTPLSGDHKHLIRVSQPARITHVRLTISPDGGVARLRVHGQPVPDPRDIWGMPLDLAALEHGGVVVDCSDMYFSHRHNLNQPTAPMSMADGWETKRRRGPGNDWVVVHLAEEGVLRIAEVDTRFFKGNAPRSFSLEGHGASGTDADFRPLLGETELRPHVRHRFHVPAHEPVTHVRLSIYPDGGVARLRLWGSLSERGAEALGLRWLDSLAPGRAEEELLACCGSARWAHEMTSRRPFESLPALLDVGRRAWADLDREDRLAAFAAHPRIGERATGWARDEQAASAGAEGGVAQALRDGNLAYEQRFGHVFLICATGLGAGEILGVLQQRLDNDPVTELEIAAAEQQKITDLRLTRLVRP